MVPIKQKRDYQALASFPYALGKFFRSSERAALQYGLSIRQYEALLTIYGFPGKQQITIGEMAEWLQIRYRSAIDLVDQLELERLIIHKKQKENKFSALISITNKGKRVLQQLASLNKQELQKLKPEIQQLSDLL